LKKEVLKDQYKKFRTYKFGAEHLARNIDFFSYREIVEIAINRTFESKKSASIKLEDVIVESQDVLSYILGDVYGVRNRSDRTICPSYVSDDEENSIYEETLPPIGKEECKILILKCSSRENHIHFTLEKVKKDEKVRKIYNSAYKFGESIPYGGHSSLRDEAVCLAHGYLDALPDDPKLKELKITHDGINSQIWKKVNDGKYRRIYPSGPPWNPWGEAMA